MIRSRKISNEKLIFRLLVVVKSISKCVINEDHVDSVSVSGESGNQELAADSYPWICSQSEPVKKSL